MKKALLFCLVFAGMVSADWLPACTSGDMAFHYYLYVRATGNYVYWDQTLTQLCVEPSPISGSEPDPIGGIGDIEQVETDLSVPIP